MLCSKWTLVVAILKIKHQKGGSENENDQSNAISFFTSLMC